MDIQDILQEPSGLYIPFTKDVVQGHSFVTGIVIEHSEDYLRIYPTPNSYANYYLVAKKDVIDGALVLLDTDTKVKRGFLDSETVCRVPVRVDSIVSEVKVSTFKVTPSFTCSHTCTRPDGGTSSVSTQCNDWNMKCCTKCQPNGSASAGCYYNDQSCP